MGHFKEVPKACPKCRKERLEAEVFNGVEIDYCPVCLGAWFEEDELRQAKDNRDENLKWLDVDLWEDKSKFRISYGIRLCPTCRMPLYEIYYGDSKIIVDVCGVCRGVWLDRAEFRKIIEYLREKAGEEVVKNGCQALASEMKEVVSGPETLKEEVGDFLAILNALSYKFSIDHPVLSEVIAGLPK